MSHRVMPQEAYPRLSAITPRSTSPSYRFGVRRFHQYLYGRSFMIYSDHKLLMYLFDANRAIPATASARVQRWALTLSGYHYSIVHRPGTQQGNADRLSRLPLPGAPQEVPKPTKTLLLMEKLDASLVTVAQIRAWTGKDPVFAKVRKNVLQSWPEKVREDPIKPYFQRKEELSVEEGCIL